MEMINTAGMTFAELDEAIAYMLPYMDAREVSQLKRELDANSIIYTKDQYNELCATLYTIPKDQEFDEYDNDLSFDDVLDTFDVTNYVCYIPGIDTSYSDYDGI